MNDGELRYWVERGRTTTMQSEPLGIEIYDEIVMLWKVVGELGTRTLGPEPEQRVEPLDVEAEAARMTALRSEIDGLKREFGVD